MKLKKYEKLKRATEQARREHEQAVGAMNQLLRQLQDKFKCKTLDEARALLKKKREEADKAKSDFNESLAKFEKRWFHVLYPEDATDK